MNQRDDELFKRSATMSDKAFGLADKRGASRGKQGQIVLRQPDRRPFQSIWESFLNLTSQ
jgi:hypothetical protein